MLFFTGPYSPTSNDYKHGKITICFSKDTYSKTFQFLLLLLIYALILLFKLLVSLFSFCSVIHELKLVCIGLFCGGG